MGRSSKIIYKPLGVVGIIPAWNYPFSIPLGEAAMALMAGNSVVIKPSELTPLTGLKIGEIFERAGLPEAFQIVTGDGPRVPHWSTRARTRSCSPGGRDREEDSGCGG